MNIQQVFFCFILFFVIACDSGQDNQTASIPLNDEKENVSEVNNFNNYWYTGKAEISSYTLKQSRYNDLRDGEVVLIFVTEPFSESKQVKLDYPKESGQDNVTVMKLNHVRKFKTGIYDYSIMTSTFTPINTESHPYTLKSTTSIQEWCGHTFTQLNLNGSDYHFKQFSYFESEGDEEKKIEAALLEEELLTRIRITKGQLPEGEINLIPSTIYSRFTHKSMEASKAQISKTKVDDTLRYTIKYLQHNRTITIDVENKFPYKIFGWTENNGDVLLTTARLKASINEPYWEQKKITDEAKREELKLLN